MNLAQKYAVLDLGLPFPGAALGMDFTKGKYQLKNSRYGSFLSMPGTSFTRASIKYAQSSTGLLTSFAVNTPAITDLGVLIEEARTNQILQSQTFENASWVPNAGSVTANQITAPDGTLTADLYSEDGTSSVTHGPSQLSLSVSPSTTYAISVYLKYLARPWIALKFADASSALIGTVWFNIQTGVVGTNAITTGTFVSAAITPVANGFYRLSVVATTAAASSSVLQLRIIGQNGNNDASAYTGINGPTTYYWGAQLEAGAFITSYIITTTASATRAADAMSITYSPNGSSTTLTYGTSSIANPSPTSPINLGATSGGAWVNNYVRKFVVFR